jgi:hypothetical protein
MSLRQGTGIVVAAFAAALLLTGCTPAPTAPAAAAVSTSTPAPTATAAPIPPTCAEMAPQATLAALSADLEPQPPMEYTIAPPAEGTAAASRAQFTTAVYPPSATTVLAALQAGYFNCQWRSSDYSVNVEVLPRATAAFTAYTGATKYDIATFDGLAGGDQSTGGCANGDGSFCEVEALAGTTWIAARVASSDLPAADVPAIKQNLQAILTSTLAVVKAAGPLVAAQPQPASRWQSVGDCGKIDDALASVYPSAGGTHPEQSLDITGADEPVFRAAVAQSGAFSCSTTAATVVIVPGADASAPLAYTDATPPQMVSISGVVDARDACVGSQPNQCWTEGYVDHALVTISQEASATRRHAVLGEIAAGLG